MSPADAQPHKEKSGKMMAGPRQLELGEFLRSRRARLNPAELGLPVQPHGRRLAGLRREELALLAGVSADYYTRLEQGRATNVSTQVLDAVANTLRLDEFERRYLFDLARPADAGPETEPKLRTRPRPALRMLVEALDPTPALLHSDALEVVAINRMAKVLLDDFDTMPIADRNLARWIFLDPKARRTFPDWPEIAAQTVAVLRATAGQRPRLASLATLVDELTTKSEQFRQLWEEYRVYRHTHGTQRFRHETVGTVTLNYQSLMLPAEPELSLLIYTADTGSASQRKLRAFAEEIGIGDGASGAVRS
jgi:transcriptional regulator with XRE-family HTH domain